MPFPWFTSSSSNNNSRPPPLQTSSSSSSSAAIVSRSGSGRGSAGLGGGAHTRISSSSSRNSNSNSNSLLTTLPSSRLDDVRAKTRTSYMRNQMTQSHHNIDLSNSRGRLRNGRGGVSIGSSAPSFTTIATTAPATMVANNTIPAGGVRSRGIIVAIEPSTSDTSHYDASTYTSPPSLSSSRHTPTNTNRRIDQGLIDASRLSQNPVLLGTTTTMGGGMGGGEQNDNEKMAMPSLVGEGESSVVPTQHKRWWPTIVPSILGGEEKTNASVVNTTHDADATIAAAAAEATLKHRRSVSYNTTYHVP